MRKRLILIYFFVAGLAAATASFSDLLKVEESASTVVVTEQQLDSGPIHTGGVTSSTWHSLSSLVLPSPFVIQSHFPSCFLFEIFIDGDAKQDQIEDIDSGSRYPDVYFRIIFTQIICPNAP